MSLDRKPAATHKPEAKKHRKERKPLKEKECYYGMGLSLTLNSSPYHFPLLHSSTSQSLLKKGALPKHVKMKCALFSVHFIFIFSAVLLLHSYDFFILSVIFCYINKIHQKSSDEEWINSILHVFLWNKLN